MILNEGYDKPFRAIHARGKSICIDKTWMLDTSMSAGTHIFGYNSVRVRRDNTLYAFPCKVAEDCAGLLQECTGFDRFVFCNTGSEATMRAIRIARAYTGRDNIALFEGCWHGTHDWNLALYSKGIPQNVKDMVDVLRFDESAIDRIRKSDIAVVMIEPIQASLPVNRKEFLLKLQAVCHETGTVLCFDEVISGFRMALGGAVEYYNIRPDLVTYGKIAGGGYPIGIVAGGEIMDVIRSGVRMGGTFSGNPLTMHGCRKMLKMLLKCRPYECIHVAMSELVKIHTDSFHFIVNGGMSRLMFTGRPVYSIEDRDKYECPKDEQQQIIEKLYQKGIYLSVNHNMYFSTLHSIEDVEFIGKCLTELS